MTDKPGCLSNPGTPLSTAGNTPVGEEASFIFSRSISRVELKEDVLILKNLTWDYSLISPEEIARLSRAISRLNAFLVSNESPNSALVAWRVFQAADRQYNGYVTMSDLHRVISNILPNASRYDTAFMSDVLGPSSSSGQVSSPSHALNGSVTSSNISTSKSLSIQPLQYWDVLIWWKELKMPKHLKILIEEKVANKLVVPSDGLWAGVSLSANIRVWKTICRSIGFLFRFCAENYVFSSCRSLAPSVQTTFQVSTDFSRVFAQIELVCLCISECVSRVHADLLHVWENFILLDSDCKGYLTDREFSLFMKKAGLRDTSFSELLQSTDRIVCRHFEIETSESVSADTYCDPSNCVSLIEIFDILVDSRCSPGIVLSPSLGVLPGKRPHSKSFWDKMRNAFSITSNKPPSAANVLALLKERGLSSACSPHEILKYTIKQYLDVEQWRGELFAKTESSSTGDCLEVTLRGKKQDSSG